VTRPVLAFPALTGMAYPRLQGQDLLQVVAGPADVVALPITKRQAIRVLITSASRGCSAAMVEALPALGLVVSQGVGLDKIDQAGLMARGIRLRSVGEAATGDVADLAMALTQMLSRGLVRADAFARGGAWMRDRFEMGDSLVGNCGPGAGVRDADCRIEPEVKSRAGRGTVRLMG
jgi:hydroxypyruvate reductase